MDGEAQKASLFERVKGFFEGVQSEFAKITFPNQEDLKKQTIAVLVISAIIGLLILIIDSILKFGFGFIL